MNLVDQPWIPVMPITGRVRELNLREALINAHQYREIADNSPQTVAALLMPLLAILQRCWDSGEEDEREEEWHQLWAAGRFGARAIDGYLARWHDRFDLFDPRYPFYQVAGLETGEASPLARLAMEENNAPAMFTHPANPDWAEPTPALAARLLVTIQAFALGFGKSSRAKISGEEIDPPYSADAPLLRGLTMWVSGGTLFETLMLNLAPVDADPDDKPCWELDRPHELRDRLTASGRTTQPPCGICDLLTLQSRLIRLLPEMRDGHCVVPSAYFTQGRSLDKSLAGQLRFHPFKIYQKTKEGYAPFALSEDKAIWRNIHAVLDTTSADVKVDDRSPLHFLPPLGLEAHHLYQLQVVGLASDPGKAGKFTLWRHDRFPLPPNFSERDFVDDLKRANDVAEKVAQTMRERFAIVSRAFLAGEVDGGVRPDPDEVKNLVAKFDPRRAYWPMLEAPFLRFMSRLDERNAETPLREWHEMVEKTGRHCFEDALNSLGHSRRAVVATSQVSSMFNALREVKATQNKTKKGTASTQAPAKR